MARKLFIRWKTLTILSVLLIAAAAATVESNISDSSTRLQCLVCGGPCDNLTQQTCDPGDRCQITFMADTPLIPLAAGCAQSSYCENPASTLVIHCCSMNNCTSSFLYGKVEAIYTSSIPKSQSVNEIQGSNTFTTPSSAMKLFVSRLSLTIFTGTLVLFLV